MKADYYYQFSNGNQFQVQQIINGLCHCRVINKYDVFYMTVEDGDAKVKSGELIEIDPQTFDLTKDTQHN